MTNASTVRALTREAKVQQRIKQRNLEWWHRTQCPNCRAKVDLLKAMQEAAGASVEAHYPKQTAH